MIKRVCPRIDKHAARERPCGFFLPDCFSRANWLYYCKWWTSEQQWENEEMTRNSSNEFLVFLKQRCTYKPSVVESKGDKSVENKDKIVWRCQRINAVDKNVRYCFRLHAESLWRLAIKILINIVVFWCYRDLIGNKREVHMCGVTGYDLIQSNYTKQVAR